MRNETLTSLEITVLALACRDPLSSILPRKRFALYPLGPRPHSPLANPRLEALRRFVILYRLHGRELPAAERARIRAAGYDPRQIAAIEKFLAPAGFPQGSGCHLPAHTARGWRTIFTGWQRPRCRRAPHPIPNRSREPRGAIFVRISVNGPISTPFCLAIATALLTLSSVPSAAQSQNQVQPQQQRNGDHVVIGVGAGYGPAYPGAEDYRVMPLPVIDIAWGPFFANLRNGIGINAVDTDHVTIGASVAMMPGYRSKDAPRGIGELSFGAGARGFMSLKAAGFVATIGATKGFAGGTKGLIADASLSRPVFVSSRFMLVPTVAASWADGKHNDRFFGVNAAQSRASGLRQYRPGSGFSDASAMLTAQYRLTDRISLAATGGVTTLLGRVKDSPIVAHKTQPLGFVSVSYRLGQ